MDLSIISQQCLFFIWLYNQFKISKNFYSNSRFITIKENYYFL